MAAHPPRLAALFTPTYVRLMNHQIVHPASSVTVKPSELHSSLARPMQVAHYEPDRSASYIAASLSYGLIKGHPFLDGNKRTAFFVTNEYLRAQGAPGLADGRGTDISYADIAKISDPHVSVAKGELDVAGFDAQQRNANADTK